MDSIKGSGKNKNAWKCRLKWNGKMRRNTVDNIKKCRLKCNGKMRRNTVDNIKSLVKNMNAWKCLFFFFFFKYFLGDFFSFV